METAVGSDSPIVAAGYSKRPALAKIYAVAGRFLLFESEDAITIARLNRVLSRLYLTQSDERGDIRPDASIRFHRDISAARTPAGLDCFEVSDGGKCWTDGKTYLFDFPAGRLIVSPETSQSIEVFLDDSANFSDTEWSQILYYAISTALRRCGLYELHSAAVIAPHAVGGVLFVGPSGSGKSTLTLQLAASGWQYLTDDVLLLQEESGAVDVHAFRRSFAVTEKTMASSKHYELQEASAEVDWPQRSKWPFTPHQYFPDGFVSACRPRAIFYPRIVDDEASCVRRLSRAEAMTRLIRMCPWVCYDRPTSSEHLRVMEALAKQCLSFELLSGRDLLNDSERASHLILSKTTAELGTLS